jgi:hypothetical protein
MNTFIMLIGLFSGSECNITFASSTSNMTTATVNGPGTITANFVSTSTPTPPPTSSSSSSNPTSAPTAHPTPTTTPVVPELPFVAVFSILIIASAAALLKKKSPNGSP